MSRSSIIRDDTDATDWNWNPKADLMMTSIAKRNHLLVRIEFAGIEDILVSGSLNALPNFETVTRTQGVEQ
jgi:hypothetical protein